MFTGSAHESPCGASRSYTARMPMTPRACIVAAFAAEARPLRRRLKLKRHDHAGIPYPLYLSDDCLLLETGLGKLRASAAVASVLTAYPSVRTVLNIGIAGGAADLGSCHLGHAIHDRASGRYWYPDLPPSRLFSKDVGHTLIETVDTPEQDYRPDRVFDMEAAGVMAAAVPVVGTAGILCLKVISDGPDTTLETLNKRRVEALMETHVDTISDTLSHQLSRREIARNHDLSVNAASEQWLQSGVRHSSSERHRLRRLLGRYLALYGRLPDNGDVEHLPTAAAIAAHVEDLIKQANVEYR